VVAEAAGATCDAGFGLKAATITPEGVDDVGSPNRILRSRERHPDVDYEPVLIDATYAGLISGVADTPFGDPGAEP
jgi:hypothetical protein